VPGRDRADARPRIRQPGAQHDGDVVGGTPLMSIGRSAADSVRGHEVVTVDLMLASVYGEFPVVPRGCTASTREGLRIDGAVAGRRRMVCHQAAVVGASVDANDGPAFASHNDFGTAMVLATMYRTRCHLLALASSMAVSGVGRYRCESHVTVDPPPRLDRDRATVCSTTGARSEGSH